MCAIWLNKCWIVFILRENKLAVRQTSHFYIITSSLTATFFERKLVTNNFLRRVIRREKTKANSNRRESTQIKSRQLKSTKVFLLQTQKQSGKKRNTSFVFVFVYFQLMRSWRIPYAVQIDILVVEKNSFFFLSILFQFSLMKPLLLLSLWCMGETVFLNKHSFFIG